MKKRVFLFVSIFGLLCCGCGKTEATNNDVPPVIEENDSEKKTEVIYDEKEDSMEGLDPNDFSNLTNSLLGPNDEYLTYTQQYFNDSAKEYYKINYGEELPFSYRAVHKNIASDDFNLFKFDADYITNHEFTRISERKFETKNAEAVKDLLYEALPIFKNEGYYMTFSRATVETSEDNNLYRIYIYANKTQIGKLVPECKNLEYKNWYLLFAACEITSITRNNAN